MRDPCAVEAVGGLALFVFSDPDKSALVELAIPPVGDICRHSANRVRAAMMTGPYHPVRVSAHERHGHRDLSTVGENTVGTIPELLDDAEDVIPTTGVEPGGATAEFEENLIHLKRSQNGLDEHRGLYATVRQP